MISSDIKLKEALRNKLNVFLYLWNCSAWWFKNKL